MSDLRDAMQDCDKPPSWWQGLIFAISMLPSTGRTTVAVSLCALVVFLVTVLFFRPPSFRLVNQDLSAQRRQQVYYTSPVANTVSTTTTAQSATTDVPPRSNRTIHFPEDHSIGLLNITELDASGKPGAPKFVDARGAIAVPARALVKIAYVLPGDALDMGFVAKLGSDDLQNLNMIGAKISAKGIREISRMKGLKTLSLFSATLPDRAPWKISLPLLEEVDFGQTALSNNALEQIVATCPRLKNVSIPGTPVSDEGLAPLTHLPNLTGVRLSDMPHITDSCLQTLVGVPTLLSIDLGSDKITARGIKTLSQCKHLKKLILTRTRIDDADIDQLASSPSLFELNVANTGVSDAAIPALSKMLSLRHLNLSSTKVTSAGVARLKQALPKCSIES